MALERWALPQLSELLPLDEAELKDIISYTNTLPESEGTEHLSGLLGESPEALQFITTFYKNRADMDAGMSKMATESKDIKGAPPAYAPPPGPPPSGPPPPVSGMEMGNSSASKPNGSTKGLPPQPQPSTGSRTSRPSGPPHTNAVIEAAKVRATDEQDMQQMLQNLQFAYGIYNSEIEPEHDSDYPCNCAIHRYKARKWNRYGVQEMWSRAVMYPGEKAYNDNQYSTGLFSSNPYRMRVISPFGYNQWSWGPQKPQPSFHARAIHQTISLNNSLNREAQASIDSKEPNHSIWDDKPLESVMSTMSIGDHKRSVEPQSQQRPSEKGSKLEKRQSLAPSSNSSVGVSRKPSKFSSFTKSLGIKSSEERAVGKAEKAVGKGNALRDEILSEEQGRWPDEQWRNMVEIYQEKVGMSKKITDLRARYPIQYLHLLRAGYFEPIPVAWATQNSNPLKFSIEAAAGWRGITPAWRGYEDTAEERLYWVLNHREGSAGTRMKPDFISAMNLARERMARAVEPPPLYFDAADTCHVQHTSEGYSKQVMPPPFSAYDRPETPTDDTMILLDVSGSMDFTPQRPVYNQYLITGFARSTQPKNKDVAKAITRRFADAMANHDHTSSGYDLVTFSQQASYIGSVNHQNLDSKWKNVRFGGGTRVMTGWQKVKELHFQKHSESAIHHPIYGWQAGPQTPMLRLLLMLDGEATDMDEFELDLLGLSWAHVTIFLIGVDGCPHHHRHANELQRISDVNHHVSFVDAQGNCPERFVTHELLKRHLGYDITMQEFEEMEELPPYTA